MFKRVNRMILTCAALSAFVMASQAGAADKLVVKGTDGATSRFTVDDSGKITESAAVANTAYLQELKNNLGAGDKVRLGVRADGISYWQFNISGTEQGQLMYTTPAGFPGIALYTGNWATPGGWVNFGTFQSLYYFANANLPTLNVATSAAPEHGRVGIGQVAPTQKLEVNGGIRLNPTSVTTTVPNAATTAAPTRPACDVNARGTLWFTTGATDTLSICMTTASGGLDWKTVTVTP